MTDPGKKRTAAATAARMRQREEKMADLLVSRGWNVFAPESEHSWGYLRQLEYQLDAVPPIDR